MSLIEEALRKQREETERNEKPAPPPPPEPAPETPPEAVEDHPAARRPWAMLAGLILLGILSIAFIVWLLVFGLQLWQKTPPPAPAPQGAAITTNAIPAPVPTPKVPTPDVPATNAVPVAINAAPPTNIVVVPPPPPQMAPTSQPATVQSVPGPNATEPPPAAAVKPTVAAAPDPAKMAMPVMWPRLAVTGIIGSSRGGHSAAIINGQMLSPGDTTEGVRIEMIEKQRVKFSYQGEVKVLSVGGTTE